MSTPETANTAPPAATPPANPKATAVKLVMAHAKVTAAQDELREVNKDLLHSGLVVGEQVVVEVSGKLYGVTPKAVGAVIAELKQL